MKLVTIGIEKQVSRKRVNENAIAFNVMLFPAQGCFDTNDIICTKFIDKIEYIL